MVCIDPQLLKESDIGPRSTPDLFKKGAHKNGGDKNAGVSGLLWKPWASRLHARSKVELPAQGVGLI